MNIYLIYLMGGAAAVAAVFLLLWIPLWLSARNRRIDYRSASLKSEELEDHAHKAAIKHTITKKKNTLNWPLPRLNANYDYILSTFKELSEDIRNGRDVPASSEWLLDNFYVMESQVRILRGELSKKEYNRLPVLRSGAFKGYARIFAVAVELVTDTDSKLDETTLAVYLKAYQTHSVLFEREIRVIPIVVKLAIIESIRQLCEIIRATRAQWRKADKLYRDFAHDTSEDYARFEAQMKHDLKTLNDVDPAFIEHLSYRLRLSGSNHVAAMRAINNILAKMGTSTDEITRKEHNAQSLVTVSIRNCVTSLHYFASLDWSEFSREASHVDQILRCDTDGTYSEMDQATRNRYRERVEALAVVHNCSEIHIAREAVLLAGQSRLEEPNNVRAGHVGYYLVDQGRIALEKRQDSGKKLFRPQGNRSRRYLYMGSICFIMAILISIAVGNTALMATEHIIFFMVLSGLVVFIPASEIAVSMVNRVICRVLRPEVLPKMELKDGIPGHLGTVIVIPTILPDKARTTELLKTLEGHYLRNREENLYFAIIGAFRDADEPHLESDDAIITAAMQGIKALNDRYNAAGEGVPDKFYFFHRKRTFNESNNIWIGWERKRGALMEFNELLLGSRDTSFAFASSKAPPFGQVKYIITLDSDTLLPIGTAKGLIGTMAHPLNSPVVDEDKGIVTEGYALLQPRVDIDVESAGRSAFARVFTSQDGIDPYSGAVSDVYQDMFGEGIFTGKGIYDLRVFQSVLKKAVPENTVLSHDLLEGSYTRAALVTDLNLIDGFPGKYQAYAARAHRWIRGDWQLFPLLFGKIRNAALWKILNPLSPLSKWKIFDNLRRSVLAPSLVLLAVLGVNILPGGAVFWLGALILTTMFPLIESIVGAVASLFSKNNRSRHYMPVMSGLKSVFLQCLLGLAFLPHQAWLAVSAILVTLARLLITKKNMLEWITSADVEKTQSHSLVSHIKAMWAGPLLAVAMLVPAGLSGEPTALFSLPLTILWLASPMIAYLVSRDNKAAESEITPKDELELGRIARKTWRYFEEFAGSRTHYLAPDNYQEDPPKGIAPRTSPTNIGLGLLAVLTARDMGYIGTIEMGDLLDKTISTIDGLPKWNGHLYNWYDTRTLKPLHPAYVSTVDSGNLAGYLMTLEQGLLDYLEAPLLDARFLSGLRDTICCAGGYGFDYYEQVVAGFHGCAYEGDRIRETDLPRWRAALHAITERVSAEGREDDIWMAKAVHMTSRLDQEISDFLPCFSLLERMPEGVRDYADQNADSAVAALIDLLGRNPALGELPAFYRQLESHVGSTMSRFWRTRPDASSDKMEWFEDVRNAVSKAAESAASTVNRYRTLLDRVRGLTAAMRFYPLYNEKKKLFSIGYHVEDGKLTNSHYDLLASEARLVSYIAISSGELPVDHWFRMGRALTVVDRYKGLVSWTGTMFEYLMPLLIMKTYRNTLLDETYSFVLKSQMKYGKMKDMPWGMSESAFHSLDKRHDYQYKAIGVPWLGLKRGLTEDAVVAPYATLLALQVGPAEAMENIACLREEGLDGPYGFYEAADYTPERLHFETKRAVVKSFMAHHQGMSLLAINNCLHNNIMQERFHSDPSVHAYRLLLQEKVPADIAITKIIKEKAVLVHPTLSKVEPPVRILFHPDPILPRSHILSNGNYSIMVTDRGTGYSKTKVAALTRWREDAVLDPYGMFFYLRDTATNALWSAAYAPLNSKPDQYEVTFAEDKATFKRTDGTIETKMEIFAASGDNTEIRTLSLKNNGNKAATIEMTSYFEVVLSTPAADAAHPAFSNLFVETSHNAERDAILARRRPRSATDQELWLGHFVVQHGSEQQEIQYETDRMQFLGRGHTPKDPDSLCRGKPLSNTVGAVLDPIMSTRVVMTVAAGKTAAASFVTITAESREMLLNLIDQYSCTADMRRAARLAFARSRVETKYRSFTAAEMALHHETLSHILFLSPAKKRYEEIAAQNTLGQSALWRFGISGDSPIMLVILRAESEVKILYEAIKAHEYLRLMDVVADLVIVSDEEYGYTNPLHALVLDVVAANRHHIAMQNPGDLFVLNRKDMEAADVALLIACARVVLEGGKWNMREQLAYPQPLLLSEKRLFISKPVTNPPVREEEQELLYDNGLGGFHPDGREYVMRIDKEHATPAPWVNVIANENFGFTASESGSGYSWCENSHEYRLTPWSNDAVSDSPGEAVYLCDTEAGSSWTVTLLPVRGDGAHHIRHGFGYSVYSRVSQGIEQSLTQFVPIEDSVKISLLCMKNTTAQTRKLSATYYIKPVLGERAQVTAMHIKSSQSPEGALLMENAYNEEFPGRRCFMEASSKERSVTGDGREFFGAGDMAAPECLRQKRLSGAVGTGYDPCGAMQVEFVLAPQEEKEIVFLLGVALQDENVAEIAGRYNDSAKAKQALDEVKQSWRERLGAIQVDTPNDAMNLMLNGWLQYQILSCRLWARTGFYQSGGAYGFRDQLQDVLSVAVVMPQIARAQILLHARRQFPEGDVQHWWHEPQGKGVRTRFSDDFLWLPYVTAEYVRITGDDDILWEQLPFLMDAPLSEQEDERYGNPEISNEVSTLYVHCIRAINLALRFGERGLPLMGSGDWNDGMNTVGNKGRGESVWLGWFLSSVLALFAPLCEKMNDHETAKYYAGIRKDILKAVDRSGWDGNWYRRAYFDDGSPLGSARNRDCKIDSIAQSWSVIAGGGDPQRSRLAMDSLDNYLISREDGLCKLLTPPFDEGDSEPGYIKGYVPGVRENGGQYTHAAAWAIIALAKLGEGDKAAELFDLLNPIHHTNTYREYMKYKVEPYVMAADVYAVYPHAGRGGWSWYTGAASWMYQAGLEHILGFRKTGNALSINPSVPEKWKEFSIRYTVCDTTYHIRVRNPQGVQSGVLSIQVDGVLQENTIPLIYDCADHYVDVFMGAKAD